MRALVLLTFLTAVISAPAGLNQQAIESLIEELEADVRSELPVILEGLASLDVSTVGTPAPSRTFTPPDGKLMVQGVVADAPCTFTPQAGQLLVQGVVADLEAGPPTPAPRPRPRPQRPAAPSAAPPAAPAPPPSALAAPASP